MPVAPYIWQTLDYLSASRLNGEFYRTGGWYYQPNGTSFHASRPLYKAFYNTTIGGSITGGAAATMQKPTHPGSWSVLADTSGYVGARGDGNGDVGAWGLGALLNAGGLQSTPAVGATPAANQGGGLALATATLAFSSGTGAITAGLGSNAAEQITGTTQGLNSVNSCGPWVLDIFDCDQPGAGSAGTGYGTSAWVTATGSPTAVMTQADGSNQCNRLSCFWASVYPANGTKITTLPNPATVWTGSSPSLSAAYMNGASGIGQVMNLYNMPPLLRCTIQGSTVSIPNATLTVPNYTVTYDTYGAWNPLLYQYTAPLKGMYLVYHCFPFGTGPAGDAVTAGVQWNNSTIYWGPNVPMSSSSGAGAAKVQILALNAGDTLEPVIQQFTGSTITGSVYNGVFIVLFLGMRGTPGVSLAAPDITYSYLAGTPASQMPTVLSQHFGNDLSFLCQRPYFAGYQSTAQTGIAQATATPVTLGSHFTSDYDNYSGWNSGSNYYQVQIPGWYLCVQETFMAQPTLTATPNNLAGFQLNPSGTYGYDFYQQANSCTLGTGGAGSGAAAVGLYYMRKGDTIAPVVWSNNTSSTTTSTYAAGGYNTHMELIWISE